MDSPSVTVKIELHDGKCLKTAIYNRPQPQYSTGDSQGVAVGAFRYTQMIETRGRVTTYSQTHTKVCYIPTLSHIIHL